MTEADADADAEIRRLYQEAAHQFIKSDAYRAVLRDAIKDGIKEWLTETFTTLGKWTAGGIAAAVLAGIVYLILWSQGWHKQ